MAALNEVRAKANKITKVSVPTKMKGRLAMSLAMSIHSKPISKCLEKYPESFDAVYLNLIKAGESSGSLEVFLLKICANLEKKIKHLKKILSEALKRKGEIENRRSNKELGDLILSHAHSIKPGLTKALITDYYTDQRIWIKLNPSLNAADNAKKYYGKAKNESIEMSKLNEQIQTTQKSLQALEISLLSAKDATEFKSLKPLQKSNMAKPEVKQPDTLPYRIQEFQGYTLWIGKNNKANDQMLKLCQKNDLWLHAKDFPGSHVIVRKKGVDFPQVVIDFAAQLAAKNSKAKTQQVVPVIATLRKFVSKPKNAAFGEVNVIKESIIDAFIN